ncbi:hypothetical protein M153_7423000985, partial [Pseudoloma neurophilia]
MVVYLNKEIFDSNKKIILFYLSYFLFFIFHILSTDIVSQTFYSSHF